MSPLKTLFQLTLASALLACNGTKDQTPEAASEKTPQANVLTQPVASQEAVSDTVTKRWKVERDVFIDMKNIHVDPKTKNTTITGTVTKDRYVSLAFRKQEVAWDTLESNALIGEQVKLTLLLSDNKSSIWDGKNAHVFYGNVSDDKHPSANDDIYVDIPVEGVTSKYDLHKFGLRIKETKAAQFPLNFRGMLDGLRRPEEKVGEHAEMPNKVTRFKLDLDKR